jgi:hypothetical protein
MKVTVFNGGVEGNDTPTLLEFSEVVKRIKNGHYAAQIEAIRNEKDSKKQDELKKKLDLFYFQGEFTQRKLEGLKVFNGIMVIDYDKIKPDDLENEYKKVKANKHVYAAFLSPRRGIKALIKVSKDLTKESYKEVFKQFNEDFKSTYFDYKNNGINHATFASHDTDFYTNFDAVDYSPAIKVKKLIKPDIKTEVGTAADCTEILNFIDKIYLKKHPVINGQRNDNCFMRAASANEYGVNKDDALTFLIDNFAESGFNQSEIQTIVNSAYQDQSKFGTKKYLKDDTSIYWTVSEKGVVKLTPHKFKVFLQTNGFYRLEQEDKSAPNKYIRVVGHVVKTVSFSEVKGFVCKDLLERNLLDVHDYIANYGNLFCDNWLNILDHKQIDVLRDTKKEAYIPYKNGLVEVTKDKVSLFNYNEVNRLFWNTDIINRDFELTGFYSDFNKVLDNHFYKYLIAVSKNDLLPFSTSIGYLLHTYNNKLTTKAIILNDEKISDNPEGRTGKGLFVQGVSQIRKTSIIDGKKYNNTSQFAFQTVTDKTRVISFDDVKANFNFEDEFSTISEGIKVERKGKDAVKLEQKESPKVVITTNYTLKGSGASHDGRRHELEVANHYNANHTPFDEFKCELFSEEWPATQWQTFDWLMAKCIMHFLEEGLKSQSLVNTNLALKKLYRETSIEFVTYVEENLKMTNVRYNKKEHFNRFIEDNTDYNKWLKQNTFSKWLEIYAKFKGLNYEQPRANGISFFEFRPIHINLNDKPILKEEEEEFCPF